MLTFNSFIKRLWQSKKSRWILVLALVILVILFFVIKGKSAKPYQFISVKEGSITEIVSITGNTTPTESVSLGFNSSGSIANIYSAVGKHVNKGAVLANLNMSDISAQLKQAQADVDMQTAKLDSLETGASPEDIAVSQSSVNKANQDLVNLYQSIKDVATDAYAKAGDAVLTELGPMFTNANTSNPQISFQADAQSTISVDGKQVVATSALTDWQKQLSNINSSSSTSQLDTILQNSLTNLAGVSDLLSSMTTILNSNSTTISASTLATYRSNLTIAINEVNLASKNLNALLQNIASQKLVVAQAQASLALKKSGATPQDIQAQKANVENAQATVASVQAKFANLQIVAPISGVVTQFDAKVGQIATPGVALVSIISDGQFEVDADVPETDIGKIGLNNPVTMTLDAFPNETFTGSVFYINPAETITQGVVDYKIKIAFTKPDPRMKSGLTANLDIQTNHKDNVLTLPQYAILQTDAGNFVKTLSGKTVAQVPVKLGISDQNGNVEVISGVTAGEQVINIGLK